MTDRNHKAIVAEIGVSVIREALGARGYSLSDATVRSWGQRNSIPDTYWPDFIQLRFATLSELNPRLASAGPSVEVLFPVSSVIVDALPRGLSIPPQCQFPIVTETRIDAAFSGQPAGELAVAG